MSVAEMAGIGFTLLAAVLAAFWAMARALASQFTAALDVRFESLEQARKEGRKLFEQRFQRLEEKQEEIDKDLRRILIELPREYVRREDYVRGQTVIEAKIDSLALRIENVQLRRDAK